MIWYFLYFPCYCALVEARGIKKKKLGQSKEEQRVLHITSLEGLAGCFRELGSRELRNTETQKRQNRYVHVPDIMIRTVYECAYVLLILIFTVSYIRCRADCYCWICQRVPVYYVAPRCLFISSVISRMYGVANPARRLGQFEDRYGRVPVRRYAQPQADLGNDATNMHILLLLQTTGKALARPTKFGVVAKICAAGVNAAQVCTAAV